MEGWKMGRGKRGIKGVSKEVETESGMKKRKKGEGVMEKSYAGTPSRVEKMAEANEG